MNDILLRSLMFVPSHSEKLMISASNSNADVLLLDVEDSVQPCANKKVARETILKYVHSKAFGSKKIFPRVNDRESGELLKDVMQLSVKGVDGFMFHDLEHESLFTPRAMIAMGARASGVIPIDTVHIRVHDLEDLEKNLKVSKNLGFEGMLVLNPKEIPLVHKYYSPTDQEIDDAIEMLKLAKQAEENGEGVAIINGKFIGL